MTSQQIHDFQQAVLSWYRQTGRDLPWRQTTDPYAIFISELMLQQTQVDRVISNYHQWLKEFPTPQELAQAPTQAVITAWAGLGYNRRALFAQRAAIAITEKKHFPTNYPDLIALPGIGPYTGAAICSFAYNQDIALVDTNIKRIYQLLVFGDAAEPTIKELQATAQAFLPPGQSRDWHNSLMDLGTVLTKERGAKNQQQKLVELFPFLLQASLPLVSDQPLRRPKQSDYKTSRRFWRGKILDLLRQQHQLTITEIKKRLTELFGEMPYTLSEILASLEKDQFLEIKQKTVRLKGRLE